MEDYYELLEISRNASKEVIEKAYKALIRKYHPDLATAENKLDYEEKLKKINIAYETIIDDYKRAEYDARLKEYEMQNTVIEEPTVVTKTVYKENPNTYTEEMYQEEINNIKESYNKYIDDIAKSVYGEGNYYFVDNRPFKEKFKDFIVEFKQKLKVFIVFSLIMAVILLVVFLNEDTRNSFIETFKPIVDFIQKLITNIKNA